MSNPPPSGTGSYAVLATYAGDSSPSLDPAVLRMARAARRLDDLRAIIETMGARVIENPLQVRLTRENVEAGIWASPLIRWHHDVVDDELRQETRVLTGEVLYHLRTALEYLAYHLVWHDNGTPHERTAFPMVPVDKASDWGRTAAKLLPGVTAANLERIRKLQPFAGCAWTADLTELSNLDKHRTPIRVGAVTGATFTSQGETLLAPDPEDPNWYIIDSTPTLSVETHDGRPLHSTLRSLCSAVNEVLVEFSGVLPGPKPTRERVAVPPESVPRMTTTPRTIIETHDAETS